MANLSNKLPDYQGGWSSVSGMKVNTEKDLRLITLVQSLREALTDVITSKDLEGGELVIRGAPGSSVGPPPRPPPEPAPPLPPVIETPPDPTGFTAVGGFNNIILRWDRVNAPGFLDTEVYRSEENDRDTSALVGSTANTIYADHGLEDNKTYYYWIRHQNINQEFGGWSDASSAVTAHDIDSLIGAISERLSDATGTAPNLEVRDDGISIIPPLDYKSPENPPPGVPPKAGLWWQSVDGNGARLFLVSVEDTANPGSFVWDVVNIEPVFTVLNADQLDSQGNVEIPAGVYINDAYIRNATINWAAIRSAVIDNLESVLTANIIQANINSLDASVIKTGLLQSFGFTNEAGTAGWRLGTGQRINSRGETVASDVSLIVRSDGLEGPALSLAGGVLSINAAVINSELKSRDFDTPGATGFRFDVDNGDIEMNVIGNKTVFQIVGETGELLLSGPVIKGSIQSEAFEGPGGLVAGAVIGAGGRVFKYKGYFEDSSSVPTEDAGPDDFYLYVEAGVGVMAVIRNDDNTAWVDNTAEDVVGLKGMSISQNPNPSNLGPPLPRQLRPIDGTYHLFIAGVGNRMAKLWVQVGQEWVDVLTRELPLGAGTGWKLEQNGDLTAYSGTIIASGLRADEAIVDTLNIKKDAVVVPDGASFGSLSYNSEVDFNVATFYAEPQGGKLFGFITYSLRVQSGSAIQTSSGGTARGGFIIQEVDGLNNPVVGGYSHTVQRIDQTPALVSIGTATYLPILNGSIYYSDVVSIPDTVKRVRIRFTRSHQKAEPGNFTLGEGTCGFFIFKR